MAEESIPNGTSTLDKTHHIPIAELTPLLSAPSSRSIKAVVSLTWPYSSAAGSVAFLLSEPDFRLRRTRGQVRVQFSGSSAKSVAKSGISSGDDVVLSLDGVEWVNKEEEISTPGRGVEFELKFTERLLLKFQQAGSQDLHHINVNHPESEPTPEQASVFPDRIPSPEPFHNPTISSVGDRSTRPLNVTKDVDLYSTPQFLKRVRTSYGSMFESDYDPFAEEDGTVVGRRRKKSRLSSSWRYTPSRTPTPEVEKSREVTPEQHKLVSVQTTPMVDEGCQTIGLEDGNAAEMMVELSRQATNVQGELYAKPNSDSIPKQPIFGHSESSVTKAPLFGQYGAPATTTLTFGNLGQSASRTPIFGQSSQSTSNTLLFGTPTKKTPIFGHQGAFSVPELPVINTGDNREKLETNINPQQLPSSPRLQPVNSDTLPLVSPLVSNKTSLPFAQNQISNNDEGKVLQRGDDTGTIEDKQPQNEEEDDLYEATPPRRSDELPVASFAGLSNPPGDIPGMGMPEFQENYVPEDQYGNWQGETTQLSYSASPYPDPEPQTSLSESNPYFDGNTAAGQFQDGHLPEEIPFGHHYPEPDEDHPISSWGQRPSAVLYPDLPDPSDEMEDRSSIYPSQNAVTAAMSRSQSNQSQAIDLTESGDEEERRPENDSAGEESEGSMKDEVEDYNQEGLRERLPQGELLLKSGPESEEDSEEYDEDDPVPEEGYDDGRNREEYYDEDEFDEAEDEQYTKYPTGVQQNGDEEEFDEEDEDDEESYDGEMEDEEMEDEEPQPPVQRVAEVIDLLSSDDEDDAPPSKPSATSQVSRMPWQAHDSTRSQEQESDESNESEEDSDEDEDQDDEDSIPFAERTEISMNPASRLPKAAEAKGYLLPDDEGSEVQDDDSAASSVVDGGSEDEAQYVEPHEAAEFLRQEALREEERSKASSAYEFHNREKQGNDEINHQEPIIGLDIEEDEAEQMVVVSEIAESPQNQKAKTSERSTSRPSSCSQMFSMDGASDDPDLVSDVSYPTLPIDQSPQAGLFGSQRHSKEHIGDMFSEPTTTQLPTPADTQPTNNIISPEASFTSAIGEQHLSQTIQDVVLEGSIIEESIEVLQTMTIETNVEITREVSDNDAMVITTEVQETKIVADETVDDPASTTNLEETITIQDATKTAAEQIDKEDASIGDGNIGEHAEVDIDEDIFHKSMSDPMDIQQDSPLNVEENHLEEESVGIKDIGESVVNENEERAISDEESGGDNSADHVDMLDNRTLGSEIEEVEQIRVGMDDEKETVSNDVGPLAEKILDNNGQSAEEIQIEDDGNKDNTQQRISAPPETEEEIFLEIEEHAREEALKENDIEKDVEQTPSDPVETQEAEPLDMTSQEPEPTTNGPRRSHRRIQSNTSNISKKEGNRPTTPIRNHKRASETPNDKEFPMVLIEPDQTPKGHDASIELALASLDSPSKQPHDLRKPPVIDLKVKLSRALRLELPEYTPLKTLRYHINQKIDVLAIATTTPKEPERAKSGPRHYNITFHITDPSIAPNHVTEIHVFRPYKEALPIVKAGDGILLRNFQIFSLPGREFGLRSTPDEASSWAVFNKEDEKAEIRGPPVEYGTTEKNHIVAMKYWYETLDSTSKTKISRANGEKVAASTGK